MYAQPIKKIISGMEENSNLGTLRLYAAVIEAGCFATILQHIPVHYHSARVVIICDVHTHPYADTIAQQFPHASIIRFSVPLLPLASHAQTLATKLAVYDLAMVVGSGTLNDITKRACHLAHKPMITCATAPSMNGYGALNASLMDAHHHKSTLNGMLPESILMDLRIIAEAPEAMILAGLGDTLCFNTVALDGLVSEGLLGTDSIAWVSPPHHAFYNYLRHITAEDEPQLLHHLCEGLLYGGLSMTVCGNSTPASQGEHLLAHWCEEHDARPHAEHPLHGLQIAVTTLIMAELQHFILQQDSLAFDMETLEQWDASPSSGAAQKIHAMQKSYQLAPWSHRWPNVRRAMIESQILPSELRALFFQLGLPTQPEDIGWTRDMVIHALRQAHLTRDRFTYLDVAHICGLVEPFIEGLYESPAL